MKLIKVRSLIMKNGAFYIIGLIVVIGLKLFFRNAGSDRLNWIMEPTAWWVEFLSGLHFEKILHEGFINNSCCIIITPSCSGINFIIILFSTLLFSFIHNFKTVIGKTIWVFSSSVLSYILTIGVNGLRIIFSVYLRKANIYGDLITPERIHRMEGAIIYFLSLLIVYKTVAKFIRYIRPKVDESTDNDKQGKLLINVLHICTPPLFWYLLFTLGIPLFNGSYKNDGIKYTEHLIMILLVLAVTMTSNVVLKMVWQKRKCGSCK